MRTFTVRKEYTISIDLIIEAQDLGEANVLADIIDYDRALELEACGEAENLTVEHEVVTSAEAV